MTAEDAEMNQRSAVTDRRYNNGLAGWRLRVYGNFMRLARLERVFERDPIYFVTACTHCRRALLVNAKVHSAFEEFAADGPNHGAWIGRYILMPDHFHAFVALHDFELGLSIWMKSLKNALSKGLRVMNEPSPHWQKGFFDHVMRSGESYSEKWDYVRENPVRAGLVKDAAEWPYQGEPFDLEFRHDFL